MTAAMSTMTVTDQNLDQDHNCCLRDLCCMILSLPYFFISVTVFLSQEGRKLLFEGLCTLVSPPLLPGNSGGRGNR